MRTTYTHKPVVQKHLSYWQTRFRPLLNIKIEIPIWKPFRWTKNQSDVLMPIVLFKTKNNSIIPLKFYETFIALTLVLWLVRLRFCFSIKRHSLTLKILECLKQGSPFQVPDPSQWSIGPICTSQYQCTNTWYTGMYRCFGEKEKEGGEEGVVEEQRRKEEGRRGSDGGGGRRRKKEEEERRGEVVAATTKRQ